MKLFSPRRYGKSHIGIAVHRACTEAQISPTSARTLLSVVECDEGRA